MQVPTAPTVPKQIAHIEETLRGLNQRFRKVPQSFPTPLRIHTASSRRTAGTVTINSTAWTNVDTATDLILPAEAGDRVEVAVSTYWNNNAVNGYLDAVSLIGATIVNSWATDGAVDATGLGVLAWFGPTGVFTPIGGPVFRTLVSGDITDGLLTLRLRARTASAANKDLAATTSGPLIFQARNLGA